MPNYFSLTRKGEDGPAKLQDIDNELWQKVRGVEPDPKHWFMDWYNIIGLALACGKSLEEVRVILENQYREAIVAGADKTDADMKEHVWLMLACDYLEANFTSDSWYQHK
jgi:hypothetical protein